jgi:hypothetical protein
MTADSSRRPTLPHDSSEATVWEADRREDSPLLSDTITLAKEEKVDATTIYAQILKEHLPWHKRPSAVWLFLLYGMVSISGGMMSGTLSQFEITLLCREYMNRYPPSNETVTTAAGTAATQLTVGLLNTVTMAYSTALSPMTMLMGEVNAFSPPDDCKAPEIQAFTAKALAVMQVLGAICGMYFV